MFEAVNYASGQVVWLVAECKGGDGFAAFFAHTAPAWPDDRLVLVMDNVSCHRAPAVRAWWCDQHERVTPILLPVYAPNLKLMEWIWRLPKHKLACHRFWNDVTGLETAARIVLERTTARFHAADGPGLRLSQNL